MKAWKRDGPHEGAIEPALLAPVLLSDECVSSL